MVKLEAADIADAVVYMVTRDRRVAVYIKFHQILCARCSQFSTKINLNEILVRAAEQSW